MNSTKKTLLISMCAAGAFGWEPVSGLSSAARADGVDQPLTHMCTTSTTLLAQATTNPQPAPSFVKQAGQKLFEQAQKKVLQQVNQKLQSQPAGTTTTTTSTTTPVQDSSSAAAVTTGVQVPSKQSAPCRSWVDPREKPIACLLCVHGLGLQSNSYEFFGKEEASRGIATYAIDVRGFGSWMKAGGKTKVNFDECLADIKQALEAVHAANPGLPVYLLGESMGGAIALRAAAMYPDLVDGLISSVPAGERFNQGKTSMKVFLNLLSGFDVANVGNDIVNQATKNAKLKAQWQDDPLSRLKLTPQELIQFQDFMNNNHEAAKKLANMPVLFVQGTGDQLVKPEGTWELFNSVAAKDKSFFAMPGEHLIFEEAQTQDPGPRDQNFRVIASWLSAKVGRRRGGRSTASVATSGRQRAYFSAPGLEGPARMMENGQFDSAIAELERIRVQRPGDPEVMAMLGQAYEKTGQSEKAWLYFRRAMRAVRRGGDQSRTLNAFLLDMSRQYQSTPGGFGGGATFTSSTGTPSAKGKIYAFYANWADQCKGMGSLLNQLATSYGDSVEITRVDVENAASDALMDQFKIGPIPTVVFVAPNGQVSSTIIGESTYGNYEAAANACVRGSGRTR